MTVDLTLRPGCLVLDDDERPWCIVKALPDVSFEVDGQTITIAVFEVTDGREIAERAAWRLDRATMTTVGALLDGRTHRPAGMMP